MPFMNKLKDKSRCITREENMLHWFQTERKGMVTSYTTVCRKFCLMRDMQKVLQNLVDQGKLKKLKRGYKNVETIKGPRNEKG